MAKRKAGVPISLNIEELVLIREALMMMFRFDHRHPLMQRLSNAIHRACEKDNPDYKRLVDIH
jgi:hypothetical protein